MSQKQTRILPGYTLLLLLFVLVGGCRREAATMPTTTPPPTATAAPALATVQATATTPPTATILPTPTMESVAAVPAAEAGLLNALTETLWVLVAYGEPDAAVVVAEDTLVTALFAEDGTVNGSGGCNNYTASYEAAASGSLSVGPMGTNLSVCERGMGQEEDFLAALTTARQYRFDERERLQIDYEGGDGREAGIMTFVSGEVPLTGTPWRLVAMGDPAAPDRVEAGTAVTALFTDTDETQGTVTGYGGCNDYTAGYTRGDGTLLVHNPTSTRRICSLGAAQETKYLGALATTHTYRIFGQRLEVDYDDGILIYSASDLPLTNVLWRLVAVNKEAVPDTVSSYILFEQSGDGERGALYGAAGCAIYQSSYERNDGELQVAPAQITGSLCATPQPYETAFLGALATSSAVTIYGEQMALETGDGLLAFAALKAPLERVMWDLSSLGRVSDPQTAPEGIAMRILLVRSPDKPSGLMVGETGCNSFSATYAASSDEIGINEPVKTADRSCTSEQLAQEEQLFRLLTTAKQYRLLGNNLQIGSGEEALNFTVAPPDGADPALKALDGTTWYLLSFHQQQLRDGTQITAQFSIDEAGNSGTIAGSAGCNNYNASINGDLNIDSPVSSRRACAGPPGVMEQEAAYLAALATVESHTLVGDQLLLATPDGLLVYASQPAQPSTDQSALLRDATWYLHSFGVTPVSGTGDPATVSFSDDGTVAGHTGCNSFSGNYSTSGYSITIDTLAVTQAACLEGLSDQERYMLAALQGAQNYLIASTNLQIGSDNAVLNFASVPPEQGGDAGQLEAVMRAPTTAQVGEAITFDATSSVHSRPITRFIWNFGDGVGASGPVVQHAYQTAGTFMAELLISDDRGVNATTTQQIVVSAAGATPPTAAIQGPISAQAGETVTFSAAATTPGSSSEPLRYTWYFGDGGRIESGTVPDVSYLYSAPGVYLVSVLVTAGDDSGSASMEITIGGGLEQTSWVWGNGPAPITMRFAGGTVTGFAGCNDYNATYTLEGNQIRITQPFAGDNQCPPDVMEQEQRFLNTLPEATTFQISGNTLTLTAGEDQSVIFYAQN